MNVIRFEFHFLLDSKLLHTSDKNGEKKFEKQKFFMGQLEQQDVSFLYIFNPEKSKNSGILRDKTMENKFMHPK